MSRSKPDRDRQRQGDITAACFFVDMLCALPDKAQEMYDYTRRDGENHFGHLDPMIKRIVRACEAGTTHKLRGEAKHFWAWAERNRKWTDGHRARCRCH